MSPQTSVEVTVRNGPAGDLLLWVLGQVDQRVEDVDLKSTRGEFDDWGYASRPIRGGTTLSNHASATAVDFNATRHPLGVPVSRTLTAAQIGQIRAICRETGELVMWGGEWSRPDGMHFELSRGSTETQCAAKLQNLLHPPFVPPPPQRRVLKLADPFMTGPDVLAVQVRLNRDYPSYSKLVLDAVFGPATDKVVHEFQRRAGLTADGAVGPATLRALHL